MDEAKKRALESAQVGTVTWRVGEYDVQLIWIVSQELSTETGMEITPERILKHVENALKDYQFIPRLQKNPLTKLLDLTRYRRPDDPPHFAEGWALRHALDDAINAIEGTATTPGPNRGPIRAERYLSHRYREKLKHQAIARDSGWSERNLERLRNELIELVAGILFSPR